MNFAEQLGKELIKISALRIPTTSGCSVVDPKWTENLPAYGTDKGVGGILQGALKPAWFREFMPQYQKPKKSK